MSTVDIDPNIPADLLREADFLIGEGADVLGRLEQLIARYHALDSAIDRLLPGYGPDAEPTDIPVDDLEAAHAAIWDRSGIDVLGCLMAAISRACNDELVSIDAERRPTVRIGEAVEWRRRARERGDVPRSEVDQ